MRDTEKSMKWFVLLPGLAMWLGWGIRGQIGHSTGAMIPGAFVALAMCILLHGKQFHRGLVIGLTAVGFGFGADMTTLESAGLANGYFHHIPHALIIGYVGLAIKGALWSLFGGVCLGLGLVASRYRRKDILLAVAFMVATFYAGWALINRSEVLYFSVHRPEIWAGLLFGAIMLVSWLTVRGQTGIPLVFAICAAIAGGVGYPIAVTLGGLGRHSMLLNGLWIDWWKVTETSFGAFMGVGLGIAVYLLKDELPKEEVPKQSVPISGFAFWSILLGVALSALCTLLYENNVPWIILGSLLLCAAFYSDKVAWQIGVTMTFFATAANVVGYWHQQGIGNGVVLWVLVFIASLAVSWKVSTWWGRRGVAIERSPFIAFVWAILVLEYLKMFIDRAVLSPTSQAVVAAGGRWEYTVRTWGGQLVTNIFFTIAAVALTWIALRNTRIKDMPAGKKIGQTMDSLA